MKANKSVFRQKKTKMTCCQYNCTVRNAKGNFSGSSKIILAGDLDPLIKTKTKSELCQQPE